MSCSIPNHEKADEFNSATDPEGYYTEQHHAKYHGCICEWGWRGGVDGYNRRVEEKANCPFHQVMF